MQRFLSTLLLLGISTLAFAQTGTIRGKVVDTKTKEAIIGGSVRVDGGTLGAQTDVNGDFTINRVPAGTVKLIFSYISYQSKEVTDVRVESGNTTVIETELAEDAGTSLQEVVVKASRATNTEVAVITEIKQMKPIAVGISALQIQKSQDRDAAAAIRRVPGISIVDNRFVLVRGLSSRYNSVMVNDVITPSTEVDQRSFSFDLIPSNILDRMIIYKSGAAELPGDFAGGVIKIYTKRRPDQNFFDIGATVGYRAGTTFQPTNTHERGGLAALGLWNRDQQIPTSFPQPATAFNNLSPAQRAAYGRLLPNTWGLQPITPLPDLRLALNFGRRFEVGNVRVSNLTSVNYSLSHQRADIDLTVYENAMLANEVRERYRDEQYQRNTRLGILHNWSLRLSPTFNLEWKTSFNQLGFTETVVREGQSLIEDLDYSSYSQRFENRSILTTQLAGEHTISDLTKVDWIAGFAYTGRWEPDWRRVRYLRPTGVTGPDGQLVSYQVSAPVAASPSESGRFYSQLNENVYTLAANGTHTFGNPTDREPAKVRFGIYTEQKARDFNARFYGYQTIGNASAVTTRPVGQVFAPENVTGQVGGLTISDGTRATDSYDATNTLLAGYVGGDVNLGTRTSLTLGFRGEYNNQALSGLVENPIFSPLPSLNLTYKLSEKQNLRLAFSSTVNRPEFRELAPFSFFDFNFNADVRGNTALKTATIQNLDAKWELYPTPNELISVTGFYKDFRNPIENFLLPTGNGLAYTFINAQRASSYGVEVELRKSLAESGSALLRNLTLVANASLIQSNIVLGETVRAPDLSGTPQDYDIRDITDVNRPMMNQSPYLINAGVYYAAPKSGWQWNVLYNVFGPRIFAVGNSDNPTIYEMQRHVVDLNLSKFLSKRCELRLGIQDILNQPFRLSQDFNRDGRIGRDVTSVTADADQDVRAFRRGSYATVSLVYALGRTIVP
jgi:TonB-dependent receptor